MIESLFSLKGKVAVVTGASSGLGAHFSQTLAQYGAKVVLCARRVDKLEEMVDKINQQNAAQCAQAVAMDVTDASAVDNAIREAEQAFGPIDILVNNAGVAHASSFIKTEESDYDFIVDTNLKGAWLVANSVASRMSAQGTKGSIINVASILGLRVGFGHSAYAVSKAGVVQMTKSMSLELARKGIRTNALCPGYFKTDMNKEYLESPKGQEMIANMPSLRLGDVTELDGAILLLASDASSYINGIALPVDGGHLVSSL